MPERAADTCLSPARREPRPAPRPQDGLKRGQQLMTHAANMALVEHGPEEAAKLPPPSNPVVSLYVQQVSAFILQLP